MPNIIPFDFDGSAVRVVMREEEPWFVGRDVALALGYTNPQEAVRDHCKRVELFKGSDSLPLESPRGLLVIPEPDLYRLVLRSQLPAAERFETWVFEDVLPSIRKTGRYNLSDAWGPETHKAIGMASRHVRTQAMSAAVRVASMTGGTEADVERLYIRYCGMLSAESRKRLEGGEDRGLVRSFLAERCALGETVYVLKDKLFAAYEEYCGEKGAAPLAREVFFKTLYGFREDITGIRPIQDRTRVQMVRGVALLKRRS